MTNRFCKLEVLTAPTAPVSNSYLTLCRSGNVRNSEKNSVDDTREILDIGDDEYWRDLRTALSTFRERFRDLTGLKWRDRFDKPLKSKYTFIPDGFEGFDQCATKPW